MKGRRVYLCSQIIGIKKYYRIKDITPSGDVWLTDLLWSIKAAKREVKKHNRDHIEQWDLVQ